jgi:hypothetical protein
MSCLISRLSLHVIDIARWIDSIALVLPPRLDSQRFIIFMPEAHMAHAKITSQRPSSLTLYADAPPTGHCAASALAYSGMRYY